MVAGRLRAAALSKWRRLIQRLKAFQLWSLATLLHAEPLEESTSQPLPWLDISGSIVEGNLALNGSGGAVWLKEPGPAQPPAALSTPAAGLLRPDVQLDGKLMSVRLRDCSFNGNTAAMGGGACSLQLGSGISNSADFGSSAGGLVLLSTCSFLSNKALAANGGALQVSALGALPNGTTRRVNASGVLLVSNRAASDGGGLSLSGPLAVSLTAVAMHGNVASGGEGGGLAARGIPALSLTHSNVSGNNASAGSGGGVFAGSCQRVLLHDVLVEGNTALAGGGLHLASDGPSGGSGAGENVGPKRPDFHSAAELVDMRVYGNAASLEPGSGPGPAAGVQGRGGGLYVSGAVGVAMSGVDFSGGNVGRLGSTIATTQACLPEPARQGAMSPGPSGLPPREPAPKMEQQRRVRYRCHCFMLCPLPQLTVATVCVALGRLRQLKKGHSSFLPRVKHSVRAHLGVITHAQPYPLTFVCGCCVGLAASGR